MVKTDYTREELIAICKQAFVIQKHWRNRDSSSAQKQLGEAYALLKAGCDFYIYGPKTDEILETSDRTIWLGIRSEGFAFHEYYKPGDGDSYLDDDHYYLPTQKRLDESNGKDWY